MANDDHIPIAPAYRPEDSNLLSYLAGCFFGLLEFGPNGLFVLFNPLARRCQRSSGSISEGGIDRWANGFAEGYDKWANRAARWKLGRPGQ